MGQETERNKRITTDTVNEIVRTERQRDRETERQTETERQRLRDKKKYREKTSQISMKTWTGS